MNKKLIIHIGTEKTATTSFQIAMAKARKSLGDIGILYPQSLGPHWHRDLATYCLDHQCKDETFAEKEITGPEDLRRFRRDLNQAFERELANHDDAKACIISSEHFHSRLKTSQSIALLKDFLFSYFDNVHILCSLRPQVDLATSLASTAARAPIRVDEEFFTNISKNSKYYNYDLFLSAWERVFGIENITVIPFKRQTSLLPWLSFHLDQDIASLVNIGRDNTSLDIEAISFLNFAKEHGIYSRSLNQVFDRMPCVTKIDLPRRIAEDIQSKFANSNLAICERYQDIVVSDLTIDLDVYQELGNLDLCNSSLALERAVCHLTNELVRVINSNKKLKEEIKKKPGLPPRPAHFTGSI
jgi:hypothetical protein